MDDRMLVILLGAVLVLLLVVLVIGILLLRKGRGNEESVKKELEDLRKDLYARFDSLQQNTTHAIGENFRNHNTSLHESLRTNNETQLNASMKQAQEIQHTLQQFADREKEMMQTVENRLSAMQTDNQKKLDEMRNLVDEKLQKTLQERVTESYKLVAERLEQVYVGLGEMQTLASGVGDLKKMLGNVKTRGIFGEVQLSRTLEQILTKGQYEENIVTKRGSRDPVEFAVRLPGKDDEGSVVWLPIDAKFPLDLYEKLLNAYDSADQAQIEVSGKELETFIKKSAKDIHDKYIDPPNTTNFGIMFLPTEGLYAEVARRVGLLESIAREYDVNIAGPTTISALLNSLQMGFRTLAIEKRSHEVWQILGAVKTEFGKFEKELDAIRRNLEKAGNDMEKLVGTRTRLMKSKLKKVEELPEADATAIFGTEDDAAEDTDE